MMLQHPAFLDRELCKELLEVANQDTSYTTVIGKTMCTYDFYEGTVKILKIQTPEKFAVITLKFEQDGFTVE